MSVSAFDQLLLSAAGKPSLSSASKKRDFLLNASAPSRLDQALAVHQRLLSQAKQRKRTASPRAHSLKKGAWSRSVLSSLKGDSVAQLDASSAHAAELSDAGGFSIDSKVKLFFDGLAPEAKGENKPADQTKRRSLLLWPRLPSPVRLLRRRQPGNDVLVVQVPSLDDRTLRQELLSRQIERVRWRRRGSSQIRRRSVSGSPHIHRRPTVSNNTSSASHDDEDPDEEDETQRLGREASSAEVSDPNSEAAESNARLSFELMERKYNTTPQWRDPDYYSELITTRSESANDDDQQHESLSIDEPEQETEHNAVSELEALRAENAEQKALIRQLLIDNRRLLSQQQTQTSAKPPMKKQKHKRERPEDGDDVDFDRRDRGVSVASTWSTTTTASAPRDRQQSLSFEIVDGHETMVDHKFELLVAEITAEIAELMAEDSSSSVTSSSSSLQSV